MQMIQDFLSKTPAFELLWLFVGFAGQILFSARFLIQWIASERVRKSIVPEAFWYFSIGGGALLLAYAIYRKDPVFIAGQAFGMIVYLRNIYFLWTNRSETK
jgi:lipid-A-disaccharide synthase-like uncharacterized protein